MRQVVTFPLRSHLTHLPGPSADNDEHFTCSGALHLEAVQTFINSCESLLLTAGLSREEYAYIQWKVKDALCEPGTRYYAR